MYINKINSEKIASLLKLAIFKEKKFFVLIGIYAIFVSILNLALPISIQTLISNIVYTALIQPILIISIILIFLLSFSTILAILQNYLIEIFYRSSFVRFSSDMFIRSMHIDYQSVNRSNMINLVGRFFEMFNIQNNASTLIMDGFLTVVQIIVGFIFLSFYHPYLLALSIICLLIILFTWFFFYKKAIIYAINRSKSKLDTFAWLSDVFRMHKFFKSQRNKDYALTKGRELMESHIAARRKYWRIILIQLLILITLGLFVTVALFTAGGILVVKGQLSLGQLVAAEIIFTNVLLGVAKLSYYFDSYYSLIASADKISYFYNVPIENTGIHIIKADDIRLANKIIKFRNVKYTDDLKIDFEFNLDFTKSSTNLLFFENEDCKRAFTELVMRFIDPHSGVVEFAGFNTSEVERSFLRNQIEIIDDTNMFTCSIREFMCIGHKSLLLSDLEEAFASVGLTKIIAGLQHGIDTTLLGNGYPLHESQILLLKVAKAILDKPQVLVITEIFNKIASDLQEKIMNYLNKTCGITVISYFSGIENGFKYDNYVYLTDKESVAADNIKKLSELTQQLTK